MLEYSLSTAKADPVATGSPPAATSGYGHEF